tara:strand:- start:206 stop:952 length:747 start_codon:yes stop_codon:yes gene_type:complete
MKFLILILLSILFLSGCSQNYNWGWYILDPRLDSGASNIFFLISGLYVTVSISFFSIFFSILIGFFISLLAFSSRKEFVIINRFYIEIIRSIPILVLLLWVYYGLPIIFGISFGPFLAGVISLAVSDSAFEAEIFRAGIQSIGKGQKDAAKSIGLNRLQELRLVILPQALKNILPAIGNQFVYVLKMSSLVSILGLADLTRKANELVVTVYRPLEIYTFLVLEYLFLILIVSFLVRKLEKKLNYSYDL